jgi:hypothetical protein
LVFGGQNHVSQFRNHLFGDNLDSVLEYFRSYTLVYKAGVRMKYLE